MAEKGYMPTESIDPFPSTKKKNYQDVNPSLGLER